jgi:hypothetical protein
MQAAAAFQHEIGMILEGQAVAAHKSRDWICNHLSAGGFASPAQLVKQSVDIQKKVIDVIDGLTKMENALGKYLEVLIGQKETDGMSGGMGLPGLFGTMDGDSEDDS